MASVIVVAAAISFYHKGSTAQNAEPSAPPGTFHATDTQWASLKFEAAEPRTFHTIVTADGEVAINDDTTTSVFSPYSGRVTRLFVKAGDRVERGDPLMALAAPDFTNARAQLKLATENEKRQHELYQAKTAPLKDWLQAQADLETAKGNFGAAEMERRALHERLHALGKSEEEISALEADAIITAPISGIVIQRQIGLGQYINSAAGGASSPAFSIGDLSTVWLSANVREDDAPLMHVGNPVAVRILALPEHIFSAKLSYVAPAIDPATHRLQVRAEIDNPDGLLKPEMFANFSIIADSHVKPTLAIPQEAVIYEGSGAHVWVAQEDDKSLSLRSIRVGREDEGKIEVVDGLKSGEKVVTSGSLFIDRAAKGDDESPAPPDDTTKPVNQTADVKP